MELTTKAIAIVGLGCRFPGAPDPDAFWRLLRDGVNAVGEVPPGRWNAAALHDPTLSRPGTANTKWGGFLDDVDRFDPGFFGLSQGEASAMDPEQRLLLEVAWEALEHGGFAADRLAGSDTGVYVGIGPSDYASACIGDLTRVNAYFASGTAPCMVANRLSHRLDLRGPSLGVDTGCSSSLVAAHLACEALRSGAVGLAIVGGVNLMLSPRTTVGLSQAWMTAADGRCKPFDARADGYVRGEGCGVVLLKGLGAALRDGDPVFGVLRGTAVNQDGRGSSLTAPNPAALQAVLRRAMDDAGVTPDAIDYVEAHGVGSALTDAIEAEALAAVFGSAPSRRGERCVLGAVKSNIGHLEPAAGMAGLIKVLLSLRHEEIPRNLHFASLNPRIDEGAFPFTVPATATRWPRGARPRIAGVNAFGLGGTNAHVIVEEGPAEDGGAEVERPLCVYTLSAHTAVALRDLAARHALHLEAHPEIALTDAAYTVNVGRSALGHRLAIPARSSGELVARLRAFVHGSAQGPDPSGSDDENAMSSLAARWVNGDPVDWSAVHTGRRRHITLPTYPFQRRRCWIDGETDGASSHIVVVPPAPTNEAAPALIGPPVYSPLGPVHVQARLDASAPPCLGDHRILGEVVVSGPTQAALVLEAWTDAMAHKAPVIRDLVFAQPLVLTPGIARDVQVVFTPGGQEDAEFQVFSRAAGAAADADRWVGHGRGRIREDADGVADAVDLAAIKRRCTTSLTPEAFYGRMAAREVVLGPSFRWLDWIQVGDGEALGRLRDVGPQDAGAAAFRRHPGQLDAFFQILFAPTDPGEADRAAVMLLAVDELRHGSAASTPRYLHARQRQARSGDGVVGDVTILDESGHELTAITGLHFVRVSRGALTRPAVPTPVPIEPVTVPQGTVAREVAALPPAERRPALAALVAREVTRLLGDDVSAPVDRSRGLFDLGLDSLAWIALLNRLRTAIGPAHSLPSTTVFDHPSIDALAEHLLRMLHPETVAASAPAPASSAVTSRGEPIAIVGIGCRFPGGADGPDALWRLLRDGVDAIDDVPRSRWDADALYDPDPQARGKTCTRRGGFLGDVSGFDARFFGIAPREAESLDPQQRLLLEVAWEALEHAGIAPDRLKGTRAGAFVGTCFDDYARFRLNAGDLSSIDAYTGTGVEECFAAGRIAYVLGLQGPAMHVDTACSTSLVALHLACQSLREGESELALAGAANLILTPENTICFSRLNAMAPDGRCKAFDASADGYGRGEGCGVLVLKRLSSAQADGDRVLALIRGSAVNHDGASGGLTVPNGLAQQAVIRQALERAGVAARDVSYVEAHGTGTPLGDPIEIGAIGAIYGVGRPEREPLLVGSIKTNLGHLEPAAGVAGVIKVVLSMLHGEIPPHLHFHTPNSHLSLDEARVAIPTERTPWRPQGPRIAGVSSFGMSGTNAHVVLEEAPAAAEGEGSEAGAECPAHLLTLAARSPQALDALRDRLAAHLTRQPDLPLGDVCATAFAGRTHFAHRLAVVADSTAALQRQLAAGAGRRGHADPGAPPRLAFLFPGQGAQWSGMGRQLCDTHPVVRAVLEHCDARTRDRLPRPLLTLLFDPAAAPLLARTDCTQPALYALQVALAALWRHAGVEPALVCGHSVGELAAAHVAGLLALDDGLDLAIERGRLMAALPQPGAMVAVLAPEAQVRAWLGDGPPDLAIAALNGPRETVVSGAREAVAAFTADLTRRGEPTRPLRVGYGFHSPLMDPMLDAWEQCAAAVTWQPARVPLVAARTGAPVTTLTARDLRAQAREPVRFADALQALAGAGCRLFVEVGPGTTLTALGPAVLDAPDVAFLPTLRKARAEWPQLLDTAGALYTHGVALDLPALDPHGRRRRVALPTYPFERTRFWLPAPGPPSRPTHAAVHPLLGRRVDTPLPSLIFETQLACGAPPFLADHRLHGLAVLPATAFMEMALQAAAPLGGRAPEIEGIAIHRALVLDDHEPTTVQVIVTPRGSGEAAFEIASREPGQATAHGATNWIVHAEGMLRLDPVAAATASDLDVAGACARLALEPDVSAVYKRLRDRGLEYRGAFRGIETLWRHPGEALGAVVLAASLRGEAKSYHAHPVLLDAALQVLVSAIPGVDDGGTARSGTGASAYAPSGAERVRCHEALPHRFYSHAVLRPGDDPETLIGDVHLHDLEGRPIAAVEGLRIRRVASDALRRMIGAADEQVLHEVSWRPSPPASSAGALALERGRWIVFSDGSALADAVVAQLSSACGWCGRVRPGDRFEATGTREWSVDPGRPEHFERLLREAADGGDPVRGLIWLWGLGSEQPLSSEALQEIEGRGLRGALHLTQALVRGTGRPRLVMVTRGVFPVDRAASGAGPAQASIAGLAQALRLEHPDLPCTAVDLDPGRPAAEADALLAALRPHGEDRIALRAAGEWVPRIAPARADVNRSLALRPDATYLITGGLGALGTAVARWMAERGAGHVVLVGRNAAAATDDHLASLSRGTGTQVLTWSADVSRLEALSAVLDQVRDRLPGIRGVVHAAGVLDDGMLINQSWDRWVTVLAPKVRGALNLHQLTRDLPLDFFVMFSSMASLIGSRGQASYVAANAFLDALAGARRAGGLPGLSINWGPWAGAGMAARTGHASGRRGIGDLSAARALDLLGGLLALGDECPAQVGAIPIRWVEHLRSYSGREASAFFTDVQRATSRQPIHAQRGELGRRLEALRPEDRRAGLVAHVRDAVGQALGLAAGDPIDPAERFFTLGMDSLMVVELSQQLEIDIDRALSATLLFDYPSVNALAGYLASEIYAMSDSSSRDPTPAVPPSPADDLARTAAAIEGLGDDEVEAMLLARLDRGRSGP